MRDKIKLLSTGLRKDGSRTMLFVTRTKNKRTTTEKLKFKRYDPHAYNAEKDKCGMHVLFEETKI